MAPMQQIIRITVAVFLVYITNACGSLQTHAQLNQSQPELAYPSNISLLEQFGPSELVVRQADLLFPATNTLGGRVIIRMEVAVANLSYDKHLRIKGFHWFPHLDIRFDRMVHSYGAIARHKEDADGFSIFAIELVGPFAGRENYDFTIEASTGGREFSTRVILDQVAVGPATPISFAVNRLDGDIAIEEVKLARTLRGKKYVQIKVSVPTAERIDKIIELARPGERMPTKLKWHDGKALREGVKYLGTHGRREELLITIAYTENAGPVHLKVLTNVQRVTPTLGLESGIRALVNSTILHF